MPFKSEYTVDIPNVSICTLLFVSPSHALSKTHRCFIDALKPTQNFITYHAYRLSSQRLAVGLLAHGFRPSDRLLLFSTNSIYFPIVLMGTVMAGGIFTGANPGYTARELTHQLQDSGARYLLCTQENLAVSMQAAAASGIQSDHIFLLDGEVDDFLNPASHGDMVRHWSVLLASEAESAGYQWPEISDACSADTTVVLNYSSGTTGLPKGVEITHKNYVSNTLQQQRNLGRPTVTSATGEVQVQAAQKQLCFLPMYHAMAQTIFCTRSPITGGEVYILPSFGFVEALDAIQRFQITDLGVVPPIVVAFAKHPEVRRGRWNLDSLVGFVCGAAPLGPEVMAEFLSLFADRKARGLQEVVFQIGYGLTEVTCSAVGTKPIPGLVPRGAIGALTASMEGKLVDEDGVTEVEALGEEARGELWVRGPNVMKGYWRNEVATREVLSADAWLKTGDLCYRDQEGLLHIVDRRKELIKVKGNQVAPTELEALLLEHPDIEDAGVIGVPALEGDEAPRAYVKLRPARGGADAGAGAVKPDLVAKEKEIQDFVASKLHKTKWLHGGVRFLEDGVPRNPSGKILRRQLRDLAAGENLAAETSAKPSKL